MSGHTILLTDDIQRQKAKHVIDQAPHAYVASIQAPKRTLDQNSHFWAAMTDLSVSKPEGRLHTPDMWKALIMKACGHEVQFIEGLDGNPFPVGFSSSRLTKKQMADVLDWAYSYGAEHGVQFNHPREAA